MGYMTAREASEKWGVSLRQVQRLAAAKRIPGAQYFGRTLVLPEDAKKTADLRREKKAQGDALSSELSDIIAATTIPMPSHNPDGILDAIAEDRLRLIYEGELAYLRGDFAQTMRCFQKTEGDDAARLRACPVTIAAVISMGDYRSYTEIESYLKRYAEKYKGSNIAALAELSLATAAVSVIAPNMAPDWLKSGDFSALPVQARPDVLYLWTKYLHAANRIDAMLTVTQTALALGAPERGITLPEVYLRVTRAVACHALGQEDEARRFLLEAMRLCLPHGFVTPFAEVVTALGGLMEQCLEREFPGYYDAVIGQWKQTWKNWISFHNQFTKDNITLMLTLREYHIALLVARRVPYAKIAKQQCVSEGRLRNIMQEIYQKLFISGRSELAKYVF